GDPSAARPTITATRPPPAQRSRRPPPPNDHGDPSAKRSRFRDQHASTAVNSARLTTNDHGSVIISRAAEEI
ncbi:MAG TPA: hypothetical protein VGR74_22420, partial [Actinomycetota bacterium]|nr:hypothetical protein [Actinomycetota bacterium]